MVNSSDKQTLGGTILTPESERDREREGRSPTANSAEKEKSHVLLSVAVILRLPRE